MDRADMLKEIESLYASPPGSAEEMRLNEIRRAELLRELHGVSKKAVRRDLILGSLPEPPPELEVDDEDWMNDPILRHMRESGEDWR